MPNYTEAIREIMDQPRRFMADQELQWHEAAPDIFVPHDGSKIEAMAKTAADILMTFPYAEATEAVRLSGQDDASFCQARFFRKVFMVGRDTLKLAAPIKWGDESGLWPLRFVSRPLGQLSDCRAQDPALAEQAIDCLLRAERAAPLISSITLSPLKPKAIRQACRDTYVAQELTTRDHHKLKPSVYHRNRKGFRRVLHLGLVSYLVDPSEDKLAMIKQGIEMNRRYGHNHENLRDAAQRRG